MFPAAERAHRQAKGSPVMPDACATLRFSTTSLPRPARAQAVRDLHLRERTILSARLEPIEPLEPLPDYPLHVDLTKRTLPGLAVVSGTLSGLRHVIRPSRAVPNGGDDLLLAVNVRGWAMARQRDRDLTLGDGDAVFATRVRSDSPSRGRCRGASLAFGFRGRRS